MNAILKVVSGCRKQDELETKSEHFSCNFSPLATGRLELCYQGLGSVGQGCRGNGLHRSFGLKSILKPIYYESDEQSSVLCMRPIQEVHKVRSISHSHQHIICLFHSHSLTSVLWSFPETT